MAAAKAVMCPDTYTGKLLKKQIAVVYSLNHTHTLTYSVLFPLIHKYEKQSYRTYI